MTYRMIMNAKCEDGFERYKWVKLGRTGASQASVGIDELGRLFTWGQNYWGQSGQGDPCWLGGNETRPELSEIECATQLTSFSDFVKSCSGEVASMALRANGELWGWGGAYGDTLDSCASFGLPHDSGTCHTCCRGVPMGADHYYLFYHPVRCTPGYLWKDFSFDYYHATAIGMDDKLYTWGYDDGDGSLGLGPGIGSINTPTINPTLTADIKLLDSELLNSSAVTVGDKVYYWGTWWGVLPGVYVPTEITGLVIPPGETIVGLSSDYYNGVLVVLSNGELWGAGRDFIYGDQGVTGDSLIFKQITCFANPIVLAKITSLGSNALVVIDNQGDIYGWSEGHSSFLGNSETPSPNWELPNLIAAQFPGERNFIDVILNTHNSTFQAIDSNGYLWTWGGQWWGPHLALCAAGYQYQADEDPNITDVVYLRAIAGYAKDAVLTNGDPALLNVFPLEDSEYLQPLPQLLRHRPCGHWHLRDWEAESLYPANCWMPSVSIYQNHLMFVACGKHLKQGGDTGCEVMIFDYDMDANIWTLVMYENLKNAANKPGGASIYDDTMIFANWKADVTGTAWYDAQYTNFCLGVWVLDGSYDLEYTEFACKDDMYMQGKAAAFLGGVATVAYEDAVGQLLVQVTTDYGATWDLRKTVGVLADRKDWSIVIDKNGYIFLAHQVSTDHVMVERSIDNGLNWTTRIANNYMVSDIEELKLVADNDMLFLFASSDIKFAIERSSNGGVGWYTVSDEPLASPHVSSGCDVPDDHSDIAFVTSGVDLNNYLYDTDYGGYNWLTRSISQISEEGLEIDTYRGPHLADLAGYNGRFVYSAYTFYTIPVPYVAIALSVDRGETWVVRGTPLGWSDSAESGDFRGCPLFCLTDVPHLNHIWTFEKSNWPAEFVKQKDKYKLVLKCECPQYRGT